MLLMWPSSTLTAAYYRRDVLAARLQEHVDGLQLRGKIAGQSSHQIGGAGLGLTPGLAVGTDNSSDADRREHQRCHYEPADQRIGRSTKTPPILRE